MRERFIIQCITFLHIETSDWKVLPVREFWHSRALISSLWVKRTRSFIRCTVRRSLLFSTWNRSRFGRSTPSTKHNALAYPVESVHREDLRFIIRSSHEYARIYIHSPCVLAKLISNDLCTYAIEAYSQLILNL